MFCVLVASVLAGCAAAHTLATEVGLPDAAADAPSDASHPDAFSRSDAAGLDADALADAAETPDAIGMLDAVPTDMGSDAGCGAGCDVPRPIAPLSTATVTSRRPTLRWALASGTDGARVEVCSDRACTAILASMDIRGTSAIPDAELPTGVVFWRLRSLVLGTVGATTSPTWQFTVGVLDAAVDTSWGTTLDVNGDGHGDLVVGARRANRAYLYLGSTAGIDPVPSATLRELGASEYGNCVTSAGDVNGDGYGDVVVSGNGGGGGAWLYLGGEGGLSTLAATRLINPVGGLDGFGAAASSAGDVDGDGYADVIIGAPETDHHVGAAYIFRGGPTGLTALPTVTLAGVDGPGAGFGQAVASAGDVNGDGFADVLIGASGVADNVGRAYLLLGSATGLQTTQVTRFVGPDGVDGRFGAALASADDLNGDGYADFVVGTYRLNGFTPRAYVYLGGTGPISTIPSVTLVGPAGSGTFGSAVASAGDVNGDGYADLAVGDYYGAALRILGRESRRRRR